MPKSKSQNVYKWYNMQIKIYHSSIIINELQIKISYCCYCSLKRLICKHCYYCYITISICMCGVCMRERCDVTDIQVYGGQRASLWSKLQPSTFIWVPGLKFKSSGLAVALPQPCCWSRDCLVFLTAKWTTRCQNADQLQDTHSWEEVK